MLVALSSPVKFSKSVFFFGMKLSAKFEAVQQKISVTSVVANHSKSDFSTVSLNWVADREEIRQVYSTEIPSNIVTIKEVISTAIAYLTLYREWHSGSQRRATNSQKNSHNFKKLNWIYLQWLSLPFIGE